MKIIDVKKNKKEAMEKAVIVLKNGGLIVYPTETCYGVGGDATNPEALKKIMNYKTLRGSKPISIAVSDRNMAEEYVELNEMASNIYKNYLPGPITVVSKSKGNLQPPVVSVNGGVGVRYPDYTFTLELIKQYGKPITATSANVSYRSTPYSIQKLIKDLPKQSLELVDLFLDAGELPKNTPSTVLDTTMNQLATLRQGKIQFENSLKKDNLLEKKESKSTEETVEFGKYFAKKYLSEDMPCVVALSGELGAGKTQFAKGVGDELGVKDVINSPTYTIINEYTYMKKGKERVLAHMDTWRLESDELGKSGLVEHIENGDVVLIEWADKFFQEINALCDNMNVKMYKVIIKYISLNERSIEIHE
ncbi:MAG: L-threonylcarbamoyladenylate synthase [Candidatus Dojkabacteria bacterium]|jgi:L-threonylcarbamoyladenylate synthase